ncbi:MAG TPA: CGNR zinc finger domain-containing protein [Solirubrobacteraceae bacterium]|jgi:predicted RNA-binding Zn ribbon-like protein
METRPRLVGGDVALDLVNTLDSEVEGGDHLRTEADVIEWLDHVGLGGEARLADVRRARAAVDAALRPLAEGRAPDTGALVALYARAAGRAVLGAGGFTWASPVDAIVASATELLSHGPIDRLKTCDNCEWLFLDLSRNGSRRWCSMEGCGTEVKIRRLTERRRAARSR